MKQGDISHRGRGGVSWRATPKVIEEKNLYREDIKLLLLLSNECLSGKISRHTPKLSCSPSPCSIPQLEMEHTRAQPATFLEWGHPFLRGRCGTSSDEAARARHLHSGFALSQQLFHLVPVHPKSRGGKIPRGSPPSLWGPLPTLHPIPGHAVPMRWHWDPDTFCPSLCSCPKHWRGLIFLL